MWRFLLAFLLAIRCRREAWLRTTLPVPVILKRLATDLRVLLRAIAFGIGKGGNTIRRGMRSNENFVIFCAQRFLFRDGVYFRDDEEIGRLFWNAGNLIGGESEG